MYQAERDDLWNCIFHWVAHTRTGSHGIDKERENELHNWPTQRSSCWHTFQSNSGLRYVHVWSGCTSSKATDLISHVMETFLIRKTWALVYTVTINMSFSDYPLLLFYPCFFLHSVLRSTVIGRRQADTLHMLPVQIQFSCRDDISCVFIILIFWKITIAIYR